MTNTMIRYDRLYSRNEAIILFHGPAEEAKSLDGIIKGLSGTPVGWKIQGQELIKPTAVEESIDLQAVPCLTLMPDQTIKMYTINLERVATDELAWRAYRSFLFQFHQLVGSRINGANLYNSLPVSIQAETRELAETTGKHERERLRGFKDKPDLRNEEVAIYLKWLLDLAARVEPPKYVFEFTKE